MLFIIDNSIFSYRHREAIYSVSLGCVCNIYTRGHLVNMIKGGSENKPALLILFYHKNLSFNWRIPNFNGGKYHYEKKKSQIHGQLLALLKILMSKISLKYIPIHIHNLEHSRVITSIQLYSHGFLFHRNIQVHLKKKIIS